MKKLIIASISLVIISCGPDNDNHDASGVFEADEIIIPAQATGVIKDFKVEEGQVLGDGEFVGYIDSMQLFLRKKQLLAQSKAILSRTPDISAQLSALEEQLKQTKKDQERVKNLREADAATQKQLDDVNARVNILEKQIIASRSTLDISSGGISRESVPVAIQVEQLNDQLEKCRIINPVKGTVLVKYAEAYEMAVTGKALYKIADLSEMILRIYVTNDQLIKLNPGQQITILTDKNKTEYDETGGTVMWISDKAEFTPKTIQTKDERANLVYAVKIKVPNNGSLKIGMYAEVRF